MFLFYGPASAAFSYAVNYVFKTHSAAQNFVLLVNVLSIILMLASFVMQLIERCGAAKGVWCSLRCCTVSATGTS